MKSRPDWRYPDEGEKGRRGDREKREAGRMAPGNNSFFARFLVFPSPILPISLSGVSPCHSGVFLLSWPGGSNRFRRDQPMVPARMLIFCSLAFAGLLLAGCSNKPTALNQVIGKVLYKGAPLHTGLIVFTPDTSRGESGKIAFSKIKED